MTYLVLFYQYFPVLTISCTRHRGLYGDNFPYLELFCAYIALHRNICPNIAANGHPVGLQAPKSALRPCENTPSRRVARSVSDGDTEAETFALNVDFATVEIQIVGFDRSIA
jgi:hypothetical protein